MATGKNGVLTLSGSNVTAKITWNETYEISSNTSVITITKLQIKSSTGSYFLNGSLTVNGTDVVTFNSALGTHVVDVMNTSDYYSVEDVNQNTDFTWKSNDITHNNDGSKQISIGINVKTFKYPSGASGWSINTSDTIDLTTIPRASSITSASNITLGNSCNIKWTPASSGFKYKIKFTIGSWNYTTGFISPKTTSAYTYSGYTISGTTVANNTTIYAQLPNSVSGTMTATLTTYNSSGSQIGSSSSKNFTVTIPDNIVPTCGALTLDPTNINNNNVLVRNKNSMALSVSGCKAGTGSSIKSYTFSGPSFSKTISSSSTSASTSVSSVSNVGELTYTVTVTDTRGRTKSDSETIVCYDYYTPSIKSFKAYRANSDGTANVNGTYLKCEYTYDYAKVNNTNSVTITAHYNTYTTTCSNEKEEILINTNNTTATYKIYLKIVDSYGGSSTTSTITVFGQSRILNITSDGTGFAIGKMADQSNLFECRWPSKFNDTLTSVGAVTVPDSGGPILNGYSVGTLGPGESIPSNSDLNNYMTPGVYRSVGGSISSTLENTPFTGAGFKLIVEYIGGSDYIRQKIYPRGSSCMHYERYYASGTWYVWREFSADDTTSYLPLSGGTLTGKLTLASGLYYSDDTAGIDCNNSDIIGAGGIFFNDTADSADEGIHFYRSSDYWDTLYAKSGELKFHPNKSTSTELGGYKIYHNGTFKIETGTITLNSTSETTKTFATSTSFAGTPNVVLTPLTTTAGSIAAKIRSVSKTNFTAIIGGTVSGSIPFAYIAIYGNAI